MNKWILLVLFICLLCYPALANTAPTLISYTESTWNAGSAGTTKTITVSYNTNDVLIAIAGAEGPDTLTVSGGTGLTWTKQKSNTAASSCGSSVSSSVAASNQTTQTITLTTSNNTDHYGFGVWVWRNSPGIGNFSEQHTSTKTVALIPAGGADSAVMWGAFDFSAGASPGVTPTPTNSRQTLQDGTHYDAVVADITDQVSSGSVSYGLTVTGTTGPYSLVVAEVKGTSTGTTPSIPNKQERLDQLDPGVSLDEFSKDVLFDNGFWNVNAINETASFVY